MGEPLLNPSLEVFLDEAYKRGIKVNITTNGTLLKKNKEILLNLDRLANWNVKWCLRYYRWLPERWIFSSGDLGDKKNFLITRQGIDIELAWLIS